MHMEGGTAPAHSSVTPRPVKLEASCCRQEEELNARLWLGEMKTSMN